MNRDRIKLELPFALVEDKIDHVRSFLDQGLADANAVIRRQKCPIHFCQSPDMLSLLLEHGLDLGRNDPLLGCSMPVFRSLVEDYALDPFSSYGRYTSGGKIRYIDGLLRAKRQALRAILAKSPLIEPIRNMVIDFAYFRGNSHLNDSPKA